MNKLFSLLALIFIVGCTADFKEINTNPNSPIDVEPELLFRKVLFDYSEQMAFEGFAAGNLLGQYSTMVDFNLFDRHSLTESQFGGNPWDVIYPNLRDMQIVLDKSRASDVDQVFEAPALIMKAYMTAALTDIYGDIPYFEALNGRDGNVSPKYDSQEEIYLAEGGIIDNLEKAIALIDGGTGLEVVPGDVIFGGAIAQWKRLGGSLLIKSLMRISGATDVSSKLNAVYQSGNYMKESSHSAYFKFSGSQPNNFRMSTARVGDFNLYVMSSTVEEVLEDRNDNRQNIWFRPSTNTGTDFTGLLNGQDASNLSISVADFSLTGRIFRENADLLKGNLMTMWETKFLLAEAAERGLIFANGEQLYNDAVTEAFAYWANMAVGDYLDQPLVKYRGSNDPLEQIATQKWLANINNGYEGWIDYRRTGFPDLKTLSASLNSDLIPTRMPYPATEAALNTVNYEVAASKYNSNSVNARTWWDVD